MIRITGDILIEDDKLFLKWATKQTVAYLMQPEITKSAYITINVGPPSKEALKENDKGECDFKVTASGRNHCAIWILDELINTRCRTPFRRHEQTLTALVHELVHAKQFLSGELRNGETKYFWRGKWLAYPTDIDGYYESPAEIEAYGKEQHLVERLKTQWNELS